MSTFIKLGSIKFQLTFQQLLQMLTGEVLLEDFHEEILPTIQNKQNCTLMKRYMLLHHKLIKPSAALSELSVIKPHTDSFPHKLTLNLYVYLPN
jgi:hypothetical protein